MLEIAELKIGSRPASRTTSTRIEDLRAIPWVFSWSQARVMLPGWYGFGTAARAVRRDKLAPLYKGALLAFFRTMLSNMEMVLAKSSLSIARRYSELAADQGLAEIVMQRVEEEWALTREAVLAISGQTELLDFNPRLAASIHSRLPYVDALNHLQVDLMRRPPCRRCRRSRAPGHSHVHQRRGGGAEEQRRRTRLATLGQGSFSSARCRLAKKKLSQHRQSLSERPGGGIAASARKQTRPAAARRRQAFSTSLRSHKKS